MTDRVMEKEGKKYFTKMIIVQLLLSAVFLVIVSLKYASHHSALPVGCDEFGYLNLAKAIDTGTVLSNHVERPFFSGLLTFLGQEGIDRSLYENLIVPHAYHLKGEKVINQYPPGISTLLSFFPFEYRKIIFPGILIVVTAIPIIISLIVARAPPLLSFGILALSLGIVSFVYPFSLEFERINSVAPTYGLLFGAGLVFTTSPVLALVFISMTTIFRIANVLLIAPFFLYFLFINLKVFDLRSIIKRSLVGASIVLASGLGAYLVYVALLTGNPFLVTYGAVDTAFIPTGKFIRSLNFYIGLNRPWFVVHLVALFLLSVAALKNKRMRSLLLFGLGISLLNYLFFLTHKVRVSYYPYGSASILVGLVLYSIFLYEPTKFKKQLLSILILGVGIYGSLTFKSSKFPSSDEFNRNISKFKNIFAHYEVVWAELRAGTIEYATDVPTFRYNWGDATTRRKIIKWLYDNKYNQAIWISDDRMKRDTVSKDLELLALPHTIVDTPLGQVVQIGNYN